ncbi:serine/threonine-protein kinase [Terriglobus tenax]|uniref:serine/threonine-protein kinase n=1 Tax=Terriglobus tenax TaxID=1111115 RepID=UPI0021E081F3|nr:serine/threonine-protein kinase [Terriglobus tenax]
MSIAIGSSVGPYQILGSLGFGGMGSVYRAMDTRLHREVALKMLHDDLAMPGLHERFLREARAVSALNHPNIRAIFDIGDHDGVPYMVMELLDGETLRDAINRGPLALGDVVSYGSEIAEALAAAHAKNIVHRDIKPANVFLVPRPNGTSQAKVLDFGLAKIDRPLDHSHLTRDLTVSGSTVGTVCYMSPEQARGEQLDARSDLFSLGVLLYEMVTGQVPFDGATSAVIFVNILSHDPPAMKSFGANVPKDLEKIILKLLAKDRKNRYQSAREVVAALDAIRDGGKKAWWAQRAKSPVNDPGDPQAVNRRARRPSSPAVPGGRRANDLPERASQPFVAPPEQHVSGPNDVTEISIPAAGWRPPAARVNPAPVVSKPVEKEAAAVAVVSGARSAVRPAISAESNSEEYESASYDEPQKKSSRKLLVAAAAVAVVAAGAFGYVKTRSSSVVSDVMVPGQAVMITALQNQTGDATLNDWVAAGLAMELSQSQTIVFRGPESFAAELAAEGEGAGNQPVDAARARQVASDAGVPVFLFGSISSSGASYDIALTLNETSSGRTLASFSERAASKEQIGVTLDRLAQPLRAALGESNSDMEKTSVPFNSLASSSQEALREYALGELALSRWQPMQAIQAYERASAADAGFAQPQVKLAMLYEAIGAEDAASAAARSAGANTGKSGQRLTALGSVVDELYAKGNLTKALELLKSYSKDFPDDTDGLRLQAVVNRKLGHWADAGQAAQEGLKRNPADGEMYREAEQAMIALNRYEAALELERQAAKAGSQHGGLQLLAAYLQGNNDLLDTLVESAKQHPDALMLSPAYAMYLDNTGHLQAGAAVWRQAIERVGQSSKLSSVAATYAAQAALDRALVADCAGAKEFLGSAQTTTATAAYDAGLAAAMCGEAELARQHLATLKSQPGMAAKEYLAPMVAAAIQWKSGEAAAALEVLSRAKSYDTVTIGAYLRGQAQVATGKPQVALIDYQVQLQHRGQSLLSGGTAYPAAQIGLAHAYDAMGDHNNAVPAYKAFATLWKDAGTGSPLLAEAKAKGK